MDRSKENSVDGIIPTQEENSIRVSSRTTKGIPPKRLIDEIFVSTEVVEPSNYNEAISRNKRCYGLKL